MGIAGNLSNILQGGSTTSSVNPTTNPAAYSIPLIQDWIGQHPQHTAATLAAEQARGVAARATLVAWLETQLRALYATTATAGIPGTWTVGKTAPDSVAALIAGEPNVVVAAPLTAWTIGQNVQTTVAGAPGQAHWNGAAWVVGAAP